DESITFSAQQVLGRNETVFEDKFRGVAGAQAQLVFLFAGTKSLGFLLHDKCGEAVGVSSTVSDRNHYHYVGVVSVGTEGLVSVQYPSIASADGSHAGATRVGSGRGFRQSPCANVLTRRQLAHVLLLLGFVACDKDVVRAQTGVRRDNDTDRSVHPRELLDGGNVFHISHAGAATLG